MLIYTGLDPWEIRDQRYSCLHIVLHNEMHDATTDVTDTFPPAMPGDPSASQTIFG